MNIEDSLEKIKEDAIKLANQYWNCEYICNYCPSRIEELKPYKYYGTMDCTEAMKIELIERTVEVIKCNVERTTTRNKTKKKYGRDVPVCECCGYSIGDKRYNFCPNCGARVVE